MRKPTVLEVRAYCEVQGYPDFAEAFVTHHDMCGWVYGKNRTPIKGWRGAVRYWESRRKAELPRPELEPYSPPDPIEGPEPDTSDDAQRFADDLLP